MAYIGNSPGVASQRIVTSFTATSNQTTFTPTSGYTVGYIDVYHNGVRLVNGDDYTASNGTTVVLSSGAAENDVVETVAYLPRGLSDGYTKSEADARYMSINEETLPSQTGNSGEFLTTDGTNASWATVDKTTVGLSNVENKSSATIRGEITSTNVTDALTYTPVNKAGDTITGTLTFNNGANPGVPVSHTRFGYSSSYGVLRIGAGGASGQTVSIYTDPSSNTSGSFSGNGTELLTPHNLNFITPNPANNTFYAPLIFNSGNAYRPRQTGFHGTGASPVADTGSKWQLNVNGRFSNVRTNQNSAWDNSTGIFTPPVDGYYYFYFSALMDSSANGPGPVHRIAIRNNTVEQVVGYSNNAPTGYYHSMLACSCFIYCTTADQVTFRATSGNIHTGTETHWGGYLI